VRFHPGVALGVIVGTKSIVVGDTFTLHAAPPEKAAPLTFNAAIGVD
jgi:hypothetical protein